MINPGLKEACEDLLINDFDSDELDEWAEEASFKTLESQIVGLKNGFEVQLNLLQTLNISFYVLCDAFGKRAQHLFFTRRPKWQNLKITK